MTEELPKVYEPKEVEEQWMKRWLNQGRYHAEAESDRDSFSIVIPPPNVTGVLHMGHALNNTLQDILCRYKRMKGFNVLWMPGTDHAGIATQNVVEKKLAQEERDRHQVGREKFIEEVWEWKEKHGSHIIHQLQRLGASCDWGRERFTMDEGLSKAVLETFVSLYKKGLIYRDLYLINWCPRCHTALSDLEVEHEQQKGHLWHLKYPLKGGTGEITVATTRPETMLGDTAVAVHPEDDRYKDLIGKTVVLPLVEREIPIIADYRVDREFGSGAVKITPAHDFNDFQLGNDHNLERVNIFTIEGTMNENAIHYKGLDRFECRRRIVDELEEKEILLQTEDHLMSVGHCYRCKTVVEPYLSKQWFVNAKPLAERALQAVRDGRTTFHPAHWTKTYEQWMENIQPWCISRQIWWGHQIPAWYGPDGEVFVAKTEEEAKQAAQEHYGKAVELKRDEDVLDTWFSSALWPFSTLGWPDQTPELKTFYPTTVLVTAFDIIFFWVARMMMMGLEMMDEVPFNDVYIHAIVRDAEGKKMSKSKGNVIDPLEIMDKFGTDAFRFTLAALAAQGRDIKLSEEVIQGYRNFCNKIWNASRFALMNLGDYQPFQQDEVVTYSSYDFWIKSKLKNTIVRVEEAIANYKFDVAAKSLYQFFWRDFCDWYLEYSKGHLTKQVLYQVLENSLRLLHPFMPFITEEILHKLYGDDVSETVEKAHSFPRLEDVLSGKQEKTVHLEIEIVDLVTSVIDHVRSIRGENRIPPALEITTIIYAKRPEENVHYQTYSEDIKRLTRTNELQIVNELPKSKGLARGVISEDLQVFIPLEGLIDFAIERQRLEKEIGKLEKEKERIANKLANKKFVDRAPEEVVVAEKEKLSAMKMKIERLSEAHTNLLE
jgi:valyl-tRNA synthetase